MPAFFRYFSSRVFVLLATLATLLLIVSVTTGGFRFDVGSLRVSVRQPLRPLVAAVILWFLAFRSGRTAVVAALSPLAPVASFVDRHAPALVAVIAAAAAAAGISYGTYAANGADSSGYVSQSALLTSGQLSITEPLIRQVSWPDAAWSFSPLGYRPGPSTNEIVPTYPPGYPLALAAARLVGGELAGYLVVPLFGALTVAAAYALAARFHSRMAGVIAAVLLATSPVLLFQIMATMSDLPATALWALALVLAARQRTAAAFAAGLIGGCALLVRPNLALLGLAVAVLAAGWPAPPGHDRRRTLRPAAVRFAMVGLGAVPPLVVLLLLQWGFYGHPLQSGYGSPADYFAFEYIPQNLRIYAGWIVRSEIPPVAIALASALALTVAVRRRVVQPMPPLRPLALLAALAGGAVFVSYVAYVAYLEWHFLRFLLPAFPVVFALIGALAAGATALLPPAPRVLVLGLTLVFVLGHNLTVARREFAFDIWLTEYRYVLAGRYLESALPSNAVIVAMHESGSARYYTGLPVYRWDSQADLDMAIATLTALGRRPVLLIEDYEREELRRRFPMSPIARLDWTPRAHFGSGVESWLYDPADRLATTPVITDRVR